MTTNIFDMSDTWNNGGTTFNAVKMTVNDAGSAPDSKLIDLLLGGTTRFNVGKNGTSIRGTLQVGVAGGNYALIEGTPAGGQSVIYGVDPASADVAVNVVIRSNSGILLYKGGGLQMVATGPDVSTRYIQVTGASGANNPQIIAGGGGRVEINSLAMTGNPTATTQPQADSSTRVATTEWVKQFKYVQTAPPTTFNQLAGFADPPDGTLIQGIDMPAAGLKKIGPVLVLSDDLDALENLTGTHTIYYRSGLSTWTPVVMGPSMSFTGDTLDLAAGAGGVVDAEYVVSVSHTGLSAERVLTDTASIVWDRSTPGQIKATAAAGGGNVSSVGTPLTNTFAQWVTPFAIQGISGPVLLGQIGGQPLDATLTALAGLTTSANTMPVFTGVDVATTIPITAAAATLLDDASTTAMRTTLGAAPLDSPAFTGTPTTTGPAAGDNSLRIATTGFVKGQGYQTSSDVAAATAGLQPLDATLTALAGLVTLPGTMPRFTNTDVVAGTFVSTFATTLLDDGDAATMRATLGVGTGSGDVLAAGNNAFTGNNTFVPTTATVFGHTASLGGNVGKVQISTLTPNEPLQLNHWSGNAAPPILALQKSRGNFHGSRTVVADGDNLGIIAFRGDDGALFRDGAQVVAKVSGALSGGIPPTMLQFLTAPAGGAPTPRFNIGPDGIVTFGDPVGGVIASVNPNGNLSVDNATPRIIANKAAPAGGQSSEVRGATGGLTRWRLVLGDATAESANTGSNFQLIPCLDNGSSLTAAITANRATGVVSIPALSAGLRGSTVAAAAGEVGEYQQAILAAPVTPIVSTVTNIMSLALTAGDWDVWMTGGVIPAVQGAMEAELSAVGTLSGVFPNYTSLVFFGAGSLNPVAIGPFRFFSASPITVSLMVRAGADGQQIFRSFLGARRVR